MLYRVHGIVTDGGKAVRIRSSSSFFFMNI